MQTPIHSFFLLLILTLACSNALRGQAYQPLLLLEGRQWSVFDWNHDYFVNPYRGARVFIAGDTLIGQTSYKKVWAKDIYALTAPVFYPPFG